MGKWAQYGRRYCRNWDNEEGLKDWVRRVPGDETHALCIYCKCEIRAHHSDLISHMKSAKHARHTPTDTLLADDTIIDVKLNVHNSQTYQNIKNEDDDDGDDMTDNADSSLTATSSKSNVIKKTFDVFVGNLSKEVDEFKLARIFSKFGTIHNTWTNKSSSGRRFGLVKFYTKNSALKAVRDINGTMIGGNKVVTQLASKSTSNGKEKLKTKIETGTMNSTFSRTRYSFSPGLSPRNRRQSATDFQGISTPVKVQGNDINFWIKKLQNLSRSVKTLRIQFPLSNESVIEKALDLVQSPDKITINNVPTLKETCSFVSSYKISQTELLNQTEKSNKINKIEAREKLKLQMLSKLTVSLQELDSLPLQERLKDVQVTLTTLTQQYDQFIKVNQPLPQKLDILVINYEEWKEKKSEEVFLTRQVSDKLESSVQASLEALKLSLSISPEVMVDEFEDDLLSLFRNYATALEKEMSKIKIDSSADVALISSIVQFLLAALKEESICLNYLVKTQQEFQVLQEQLKACINRTPSFDSLQAVRNKLKHFKSKLRHKLADKMDAEENSDMVEIVVIFNDLEDLRSTIQTALAEEERLIAEMSELITFHYPELLNEEFSEDFNTYITFKGLVKLSHSPDYYTMTSMGNSGWFNSQFNSEPVLIREYFLGSANKLSRAEFLSQLAMYSKASSPYLEPIQAVFFDKDNRHAYLRLRKHGMLLLDKVSVKSLTKQQCHTVVKNLALALQNLHSFNLVHGHLHPDFILVDDNLQATILPPDFSMTLNDRCKCKFVTSHSLEMIPPEVKNHKKLEPVYAVDVYNLGLIALWLHHPNVENIDSVNGTLNLFSFSMDHNLRVFLKATLNPEPILRPTIENCLQYKYLAMPCSCK